MSELAGKLDFAFEQVNQMKEERERQEDVVSFLIALNLKSHSVKQELEIALGVGNFVFTFNWSQWILK